MARGLSTAAVAAALSLAPAGCGRPPAEPPSAGERARVIVRLAGPPALAQALAVAGPGPAAGRIAAALRARTEENARRFGPLLEAWEREGRVGGVRWLGVVNGFSVEATPEAAAELALQPGVVAVTADAIDVVPLAAPAEPNVAAVEAPALWALGWTGEGATVAVLDSGIDPSHPDLAGRLRGWFDPYGVHATPVDLTGHGTWVAGVIAGGEAGGSAIGVAPGAGLLAARVFPDAGAASATAIHAAFEWVLDPDGDPDTEDAPRIVNGSWGLGSPGCREEFRDDVQALRAAGILPVFAAGNQGPADGTGVSPGNYPEVLSVGAAGPDGAPWAGSSRGPSACGGSVFPTLAAPGVDVLTTDLLGGYLAVSGTSIAAPHVAGVAALLAGEHPEATADALEAALVAGARDLGAAGADGATGHGLVDASGARERLGAGGPRVNVAPLAVVDRVACAAGRVEVDVTSNDLDVDGWVVAGTVELVTPPRQGRVALEGGRVLYAPRRGARGKDRFTYRVMDDRGAWSQPASVHVRLP